MSNEKEVAAQLLLDRVMEYVRAPKKDDVVKAVASCLIMAGTSQNEGEIDLWLSRIGVAIFVDATREIFGKPTGNQMARVVNADRRFFETPN